MFVVLFLFEPLLQNTIDHYLITFSILYQLIILFTFTLHIINIIVINNIRARTYAEERKKMKI